MHEVLLSPQVERDLRRLPAEVFQRLITAIRALRANARPHGCRKLRGSPRDDYRIRVGDYRVVYEIDDGQKTVRIMRVRHRREVFGEVAAAAGRNLNRSRMPKVYVAGSINMDLVTRADRHPRAGETVSGSGFATYPGGKGANQAVASAKLGADTLLLGKVGSDPFGDQLRGFLHGQGVKLDHVRSTGDAPTGVALVVVAASGENSIVVVPGANGLLDPSDVDAAPIEKGDVVLSQFEIPLATIAHLFTRCRTIGAVTILNPAPAKPCPPDLLALADILILNETELAFFLGVDRIDPSSPEAVATAARRLRTHPEQVIVATLGARGALAIVGERRVPIPGRRVKVIDTTGAGDSFTGAIAARLAAAWTLERALAYANAAASICVQRQGAGPSMPTADEVDGLLKR